MNDLYLCLEVVSRSRQPLRYIRRWISRKPLEIEAWFQRTANRKWHMEYQIVTWPMTSRDPQRYCKAVRSAILRQLGFLLWYLSVCLSHSSHTVRLLERRIKSIFHGNLTTYSSEWWSNCCKTKRLKVKVTVNENAKIVLAHIFVKSGSIYIKPIPKRSLVHSTVHIGYSLCTVEWTSDLWRWQRQIHFTSENA